jgi:hypothetical protein
MKPPPDYRTAPLGVRWHFLDSGAFTMQTWAKEWQARTKAPDRWGYYDTAEHWEYVDAYCRFVIEHMDGIDYFAGVDAIGHPGLSYRNQKYVERRWKIEPVPVVHTNTDISWVRRYVEEGYTFIGLGSAVDKVGSSGMRDWMDRVFEYVCDTPDRTPRVRVHGFGVTRFSLFTRYPWYSVDSASWTKVGAYGGILVPHFRGGRFVFTQNPYVMKVADESPDKGKAGGHYANLPPLQKRLVRRWLDYCGLPLGDENHPGVVNDHCIRKDACVQFFEGLAAAVPAYPWAWRPRILKGLGI